MPQLRITSPPGKTLMSTEADKYYQHVLLGTSSLHPSSGGGNIAKSVFQTGTELGIPNAEEEAFGNSH